MERFCLDCNSLLRGRTDKKFCGDQCRSNHHHRLKANDQSFVNQINRILKRNRSILKAKNPTGKTKIKRDELLIKGFDFSFYTHTYQTQRSDIYFFCYEYGYLMLGQGELLLVRQEAK